MGEPGTQDVVRLEDLEASRQLTGRKHILSLLVENRPGVLARIAGLFSRRGFNIDTLAVGPTEDPDISRVTLTLEDRKSTRLNSSHANISYAVFCLKKKKIQKIVH